MATYFVLDEHGTLKHAVTESEWLAWAERTDRLVERTIISRELMVLTVFYGRNLSNREHARPYLYITRMFGGEFHGQNFHTPTKAQALRMHAWAVGQQKTLDPAGLAALFASS